MKKVLTIPFIIGLLFSLMFNNVDKTLADQKNKLSKEETEKIKENGDKIYKDIKEKKVKPLNPNMEVYDNEGNLVWKGTFKEYKKVKNTLKIKMDEKYKQKGLKAPEKLSTEQIEELRNKKYKK